MEVFILVLFLCLAVLFQLADADQSTREYEKSKREQKRSQRINTLRTISTANGYKFLATGNRLSGLIPEEILSLLPQSRFQKFKNILSGEKLGIPFKLFDYEEGQSIDHYKQTILAYHVHQTKGVSPYFLVRPRRQNDVLKRFGASGFVSLLGLLPQEYTLLALKTDKRLVKRVMDVISIYKWPQLSLFADFTMCNGEWVIFYKHHQLLTTEPEAIERFLELGAEIASAILVANREQRHTW